MYYHQQAKFFFSQSVESVAGRLRFTECGNNTEGGMESGRRSSQRRVLFRMNPTGIYTIIYRQSGRRVWVRPNHQGTLENAFLD